MATQILELEPGVYQEMSISPDEAAEILDMLATADAERRPEMADAPLEQFFSHVQRIPEKRDLWISPETLEEIEGGDCEDIVRWVVAACKARGWPVRANVEQVGPHEWHFTVEFQPPDAPVQHWDPASVPAMDAATYGGWFDKLRNLAKKAAPTLGRAALATAVGGPGAGASVLATEAGKYAMRRLGMPAGPVPETPPTTRPTTRVPVRRAAPGPAVQVRERDPIEVMEQYMQPGVFYVLSRRSRRLMSSRSGRRGTWKREG